MDESNLLLEVGAQALSDLSAAEKAAILGKYQNGQETLAGLHVFSLLMKNYKANYRMGRMYVYESQKYEVYRDIYREYARSVNAGSKGDSGTTSTYERDKFSDI